MEIGDTSPGGLQVGTPAKAHIALESKEDRPLAVVYTFHLINCAPEKNLHEAAMEIRYAKFTKSTLTILDSFPT